MRLRDGLLALHGGSRGPGSLWRFFPWFIAAALLLVIAVNIGMVTAALRSFPGKAGSDGFDLSNRYNAVIDHMKQQSLLGWSVRAEAEGRRPVLVLSDRSGAPLAGATLRATAERPVGPSVDTVLAFHETTPGRYVADRALTEPGQWELLISATARGRDFNTTSRVQVR